MLLPLKGSYTFLFDDPGRLISLLGMVDKNSPTYAMIKNFIDDENPELYAEILDLVI